MLELSVQDPPVRFLLEDTGSADPSISLMSQYMILNTPTLHFFLGKGLGTAPHEAQVALILLLST